MDNNSHNINLEETNVDISETKMENETNIVSSDEFQKKKKNKSIKMIIFILLAIICGVRLSIYVDDYMDKKQINDGNSKSNKKNTEVVEQEKTKEHLINKTKQINIYYNKYYDDYDAYIDTDESYPEETFYDTYNCKSNNCTIIKTIPIMAHVIIYDDGYYVYEPDSKQMKKLNIEEQIDGEIYFANVWNANKDYFLYKTSNNEFYAIYDLVKNKRISDYIYLKDIDVIFSGEQEITILVDKNYDYIYLDYKNDFKTLSKDEFNINKLINSDIEGNYYKTISKCNFILRTEKNLVNVNKGLTNYDDIFSYILDQENVFLKLQKTIGITSGVVDKKVKEFSQEESRIILNNKINDLKQEKIFPIASTSSSYELVINYRISNNELYVLFDAGKFGYTIYSNDIKISEILDKNISKDAYSCRYGINIFPYFSDEIKSFVE